MCMGIPARITAIMGQEASVDIGDGRSRRAVLASATEVRRGDFVLLYGDTVLDKIRLRSALETLGTMRDLAVCAAQAEGRDSRRVEQLYEARAKRLAGPRGSAMARTCLQEGYRG